MKDAAFSEGRRDTSSALCHARSSETDQMVQWHAVLPGQVSPACAYLSLTGSCQHPLLQQEQEPRQQAAALCLERLLSLENWQHPPATAIMALCAWLREQGAQ